MSDMYVKEDSQPIYNTPTAAVSPPTNTVKSKITCNQSLPIDSPKHVIQSPVATTVTRSGRLVKPPQKLNR